MCSGQHENAIVDFNRTCLLFCKNSLMKIRHFIIAPASVYSLEQLIQWSITFGDMFNEYCFKNGYQMYFGIHIDKPIPHIHFALNPISYDNGAGFPVLKDSRGKHID